MMPATPVGGRAVRSLVPAQMDRLPWARFHNGSRAVLSPTRLPKINGCGPGRCHGGAGGGRQGRSGDARPRRGDPELRT